MITEAEMKVRALAQMMGVVCNDSPLLNPFYPILLVAEDWEMDGEEGEDYQTSRRYSTWDQALSALQRRQL